MNANELADIVDKWAYKESAEYLTDAATMLRQQQDEIAQLKHINKNWQISENILLLELEKLQHRELTDEEIWELHQEHIDEVTCGHSMKTVGFVEFARAILRKAQEK